MVDIVKVTKNSYDVVLKEIENGYISHAYLINENNNTNSFDIVLDFVKRILCLNLSYEDAKKICKRLDDNNYPEVKIIEPDGNLIKKQQILDLQHEFSMDAVEGNRRIYIIRECEKMRPETANSMLKFLEEPENNITAFLITNNFNNVLPTIVSRCQIINLRNNNIDILNDDIDDLTFEFLYNIESKGRNSLIENEKLLYDIIATKDREKIEKFIDKLIYLYYNLMKIVDNRSLSDVLYYDKLIGLVDRNNIKSIINKINSLISCKNSIRYNVNINLLIDKLILSIGG